MEGHFLEMCSVAPNMCCSNSQVETNYPHLEYHDGLAETGNKSIADFIVALQRHGAFGTQCTSRWPLHWTQKV